MISIRTTNSDRTIIRFLPKSNHFEQAQGSARQIRVFVPYTRPKLTRAALTAACALTEHLRAGVTLFRVLIVPFPLPLDQPDVRMWWLERELAAIGRDSGMPVEARVVLVRDRDAGLRYILAPGSLVVVAAKKRWWPTAEARLARSLARDGHSVAVVHV